MQPRSYQIECERSLWNYFQNHSGNPICALPTGTGKSVCIGMFVRSALAAYSRQKILVLTHVQELIEQNYKKLLAMWPQAPAGIYSAGLNRRDTMNAIIFAGIASVAKIAAQFGRVDLIIIDECHLVSPYEETMYRAFISNLMVTNPMLKIIGFTATPWRLGQGRITENGGIFTDIAFDITGVDAFNRLIAEGFLCPVIPKRTETYLDTEGVHTRNHEFIQSELQKAIDKEHITRAAIEEALEYKDTRHSWLVFTAGVEHAIHTAEYLNDYGISAVAVHGKMSAAERAGALAGMRSRKYQAVVNNNILTTGFDHPPIDLILGLRPTQSTVLWVQMLGRGTRPYDPNSPNCEYIPGFDVKKENCLVLDFAANAARLGPINDPVIPRKKGDKGGTAPVKICPQCSSYVHASVRFCDGITKEGVVCNHEFKFETKLNIAASSAELIKGEMPVVETFKVDHINYSRHKKAGRPDSVKVTYYCNLRSFTEYVCVEHGHPAGSMAKSWMRKRIKDGFIPTTTDLLLAMAPTLPCATHLRVWVNKKFPEIMAHCFDGSAFGKLEVGAEPIPTVESDKPRVVKVEYDEDDIPF